MTLYTAAWDAIQRSWTVSNKWAIGAIFAASTLYFLGFVMVKVWILRLDVGSQDTVRAGVVGRCVEVSGWNPSDYWVACHDEPFGRLSVTSAGNHEEVGEGVASGAI